VIMSQPRGGEGLLVAKRRGHAPPQTAAA
jgi:hypothetical protein